MRVKGGLKWARKIGAALRCWASICCGINKLRRQNPGHTERLSPLARPGSWRKTCTSVCLSAAVWAHWGSWGWIIGTWLSLGASISPDGERKIGRGLSHGQDRVLQAQKCNVLIWCSRCLWAFCFYRCFFLLLSWIHRLSLASSHELPDCKENVSLIIS